MKGPVGRCGIVAAFLATITHCSADPEEFTFPDGPDREALLRSFLATLAFVFSKIRMPLEADCLKPTAGGKRVSEATLHGGVLVAGRVVWASELRFLHVEVDEATEQWSKIFRTNHEDDDRATISSAPPEVTQSKLILGANVDVLTEDEPITPEELTKLRDDVSKWTRLLTMGTSQSGLVVVLVVTSTMRKRVPVLMPVTTVRRVAVLMPVTTVRRVAVLVLAPRMYRRELVLTSAATVRRVAVLVLAPRMCKRRLVLTSAATVRRVAVLVLAPTMCKSELVLTSAATARLVAVLVLAPTMCKRELVLTSAATVLRLVLGLALMSTVMRLASALLLAPNVCMRVLVLMSAATVLCLVQPLASQRRAAGSKTSVGRPGVVGPAAAGVEVPPAVTGASARGHRATASVVPSRVEGLSTAASARGHRATASVVL
ncbi:hypothetical protein I4F81_010107 [Pyropia yezoensis]|uniref:Uncharacterized protein n=1 Tax=Pyropia yezoensis TaxID=2788 RepID=A0ACC3CBG5_PYRYE|nr:hypothetical protein I4F81_010107 [Neopyropia yezoensis]